MKFTMKYKLTRYIAALMILVAGMGFQNTTYAHGDIPLCSDEVVFIEPEKLASVSGAVVIDMRTDKPATNVQLELNEQAIGNALSVGGDDTLWRMEWDTRYATPGEYVLISEVTYEDGEVCEIKKGVLVVVSNPVKLSIRASVQSDSWSGLVGESTQFQAEALPSDQADALVDVTKYADVSWLTSRAGTFEDPTKVDSLFQASSEPMQGQVKAFISYGGSTASATIDVEVIEESTSSRAVWFAGAAVLVVMALAAIAKLSKAKPKHPRKKRR